MGRTNIVLDDRLVADAMRYLGVNTKREAVNGALSRLVRQEKATEKIRALRGKIQWEGDLKGWRKNRVKY